MRKVDPARALAALQFVASEGRRPKSVEEQGPNGVGLNTLWNLAEGGFLEQASDTEFVISEKGLAAIQTGRLDWPVKEVRRLPKVDRALARSPVKSPLQKRRRTEGRFVSQKQILAIYKAAQLAGIHIEVRIEGGVVRFVPCSAPQPTPASEPNRTWRL